jgi:2-aminoadipate transaminase
MIARPPAARDTPWAQRYAQRALELRSSAIRDLLKLTQDPEIISFAGGLPAAETFPLPEVAAAAQRAILEHGQKALQYGATEGYGPLREMLVRHMGRYGIRVRVENVLVTTGSQQALDLVSRLFINPGDRVVTEEPTYLGALQAFSACQATYLPIRLDHDGLKVDLLEEALRAGPKLLYVLPNFQNPTGVTLSLERRRRLIELAAHYGVPIVEDDPYGQLRYQGTHLPPLVVLDAEYHGCAHGESSLRGGVLYLGTLSKTLAPGLRIGWVVAPQEVIQRLVTLKQGTDLHTSSLTQVVAYETAKGGFLDRHVRDIRNVYRARRDAMLGALEAHFPTGVQWTRPQGGLFLWVTLPAGLDSATLLQEALAAKVAFVPGAAFFPQGGGETTLRLNFSFCPPSAIVEGVRRLGQAVRRRLPPERAVV